MDPDGPWSRYEPLGVTPLAGPPRGQVDPDTTRGWYRRVWPLLRARRLAFGAALAAALVAMVTSMIVPLVTMQAIDDALVDQTHPLAPYLVVLLAMALLRGALTWWYRRTLYTVAYDLEYDLRTIVHGHLTRMPFAFYDRVQSGQLISRANSDIRSVQLYCTFAPLIALNAVSVVIAIVLMLTIDVPLTLVALITLPFTLAIGVRLRNLLFPLSWIVQARAAEITTIVDENVQGVRVVKSFAAEGREVTKLAKAAQRLRWASVTQNDARAVYGPLMENLPRLGLAAVLLYGGILAIDGEISIGALVAFNAYVVLLQAPFRFLSTVLMLGQRAAASANRIFEVLDERSTVVDRPGAVDLVTSTGRIEFDDVSFAYRDGPLVLDHLSLRVEPGETVALVGRTGSGKSTVIRLLMRFYDVSGGSVRLDGQDVRDLTQTSIRHHVGVVLDEPFLFSDTISANIAYGRPDAELDDIVRAAAAAQADGFVRELPDGYETVIGERGYDLSGGQRQRVAIARTLLTHPSVLVLDDATSAVDVRVEEAIHDALTERRAGHTTIVIAHRLSTIALADRVALLEGGRIVAEGRHTDLLATEPRYAEVLARIEEDDDLERDFDELPMAEAD
jgi:ATP-binding cassette subfamily B protein